MVRSIGEKRYALDELFNDFPSGVLDADDRVVELSNSCAHIAELYQRGVMHLAPPSYLSTPGLFTG